MESGSAIDLVLSKFRDARKVGREWKVLCPVHKDKTPSLDISVGDNGSVVFTCRSHGCKAEDIVQAIGLKMADLFSSHPSSPSHSIDREKQTFQSSTEALDVYRRQLGDPSQTWKYENEAGLPVLYIHRWNILKDGKKDKTYRPVGWTPQGWVLGNPNPRPLYRLPTLKDAITVHVVEGEKCADALADLGYATTTASSGAKAPARTDWGPLAGKSVIIFPDIGKPGEDYARNVGSILRSLNPPANVRVVSLPGLDEGEDIVDLIERRREDAKDDDAIRRELDDLAAIAEPKTPPPAMSEKPKRFNPIHSHDFFKLDLRPNWLIKGVLVQGQPCVAAGGSKTLKTCILISSGLSVGCGTPFLGKWEVPHPMPVAILSGESGDFTIQETALRISKAMGVDPTNANIWWEFSLPRFTHPDDIAEIAEFVKDHGIGLVVVDPLYLCLTAEAKEKVNTGNVYEVGPLILNFCRAMLSVGATPLICHHFKKGHGVAQSEDDTPELEEMAMAGIQEAARQWWLVKRRRKYEEGTGSHKLWFTYGGSIGHGGKVGLDIEEGVIDDRFAGRFWDVAVREAHECRDETQTEHGTKAYDRREKSKETTNKNNAAKFMAAFVKLAENDETPIGHATFNKVRRLANLDSERAERAMLLLSGDGILEEFQLTIKVANPRSKDKTIEKSARAVRRSGPTRGTRGTRGIEE